MRRGSVFFVLASFGFNGFGPVRKHKPDFDPVDVTCNVRPILKIRCLVYRGPDGQRGNLGMENSAVLNRRDRFSRKTLTLATTPLGDKWP